MSRCDRCGSETKYLQRETVDVTIKIESATNVKFKKTRTLCFSCWKRFNNIQGQFFDMYDGRTEDIPLQ